MILTKSTLSLFVALSYIFATGNITIIVNIMSFSWGIVSGCFIGPYIWGIYSKKTTKAGAWAGMILGFLTVAVTTIVPTSMNNASCDTVYEASACRKEST